MSWISENYEKAALGGAAVIAVALAALSWKSHSDAAAEYEVALPAQSDDANVEGLPLILETDKSFKSAHEISRNSVNDREVDLFTSVPIFIKKGDLANPIDLFKGEAIHEGIDNMFWIKHGLDPGCEHSADLDPDEDGFSNREECIAGTNPVDFDSHPDPVLKLAIAAVTTEQVHVKPAAFDGRATFRLEDKKGNNLNKMKPTPIAPGSVISFSGAKMKERFKFVAVEGTGLRDRVWTIEDLKPNKKGTQYKFDRKGNLQGAPNREFGIMDSTVEFKLEALKAGGESFKVEENMSFELPSQGGEGKKAYVFKSINLKEKLVVIEYKASDGSIAIHQIKF